VIDNQANRLTSLINDLLDLSRIRTGRFVFEVEQLDYAHLVRDVIGELKLAVPAHAIILEAPEQVWLIGNADRLRQVLENLINNAVEHGPPQGEIHVTVEVAGAEVATYVSDEGEGLPPDEAERIFTQYYQIRRGVERYARGLGLGLFISRQIIEEHGGRIWLDTVDRTRFSFTLSVAGSLHYENAGGEEGAETDEARERA
jgi:signal transduction histidine kinase